MKRYSLKECARNGESWMMVVPSEQGEWVRYEDVRTLYYVYTESHKTGNQRIEKLFYSKDEAISYQGKLLSTLKDRFYVLIEELHLDGEPGEVL